MTNKDIELVLSTNSGNRSWWYKNILPHIKDKNIRLCSNFNNIKDTTSEEFNTEFMSVLNNLHNTFKVLFTDIECLKLLDKAPLFEFSSFAALSEHLGILVLLDVRDEHSIIVEVYVSARRHRDKARHLLDELDNTLTRRPTEPDEPDIVYFKFWRSTNEGPSCHIKELVCPSMDEIIDNYAPDIRKPLSSLADLKNPDDEGKIILWQGVPGTGKTYAVRALARAWSKNIKASIEVVLDPERLLSDSNYMYTLLLDQPSRTDVQNTFDDSDIDTVYDDMYPIRLIIIEDHAELFADNCRTTPGFSRFLNLTDGIIGQGVRTIFLITANEEIESIDAAMTRPGRCLSVNKFIKFSKDEALNWLRSQNTDMPNIEHLLSSNRDYTLADLYEVINKSHKVNEFSNYYDHTADFGF